MKSRRFERVRTVCLTGGPGAGKTAVADVLRREYSPQIIVVPEAASILYAGGFPRAEDALEIKALQEAIYHIQASSEAIARHRTGARRAIVCDRGTLDGAAYWPRGLNDFLRTMETTYAYEVSRYDVVIHIEAPLSSDQYNHVNPSRTEALAESRKLDALIEKVWRRHPRRYLVKSRPSFLEKLNEVLSILKAEIPESFAKTL